jgi:hypothetical protein
LDNTSKSLTENLYSKETRFVYELIQNAEDNDYKTASSCNEVPTLAFHISNDRVIIDLNEDGFTEANIKAICSTGDSTKSKANTNGYIGEKGIGFKSVFRAAHKVHIQSGFFSFAFEYKREHDPTGLGMVTPINHQYFNLPSGIRTRITLELLDTCDKVDLFQQFENLPDTLLLFLTKLKRLDFHIQLSESDMLEKTYQLKSNDNRFTIHKTVRSIATDLHFLTFRTTIRDMPEDELRTITATETEEAQRITKADIVLAFPLDKNDFPIVEDQHVFAFLPLRKVGFKVR